MPAQYVLFSPVIQETAVVFFPSLPQAQYWIPLVHDL